MPPVITHTIVVKINGVDRSSLLLADSLYIRSAIGNSTDVAELELRDASGAFTPADWDEVTVDVNGVRIFGGYIVQRNASSVGAGTAKRATWQVTCKDWSILLDRVLVNRQFKLAPDAQIVETLFDLYLGIEGFGLTHVTLVKDDIDINFEEITLREALNELAARSGANWHIAPDRGVWWYDPGAPVAAPFDISQTPNNTTTFAPLDGTLTRAIDSSQIINRVRVIGAETASTALQVDTFAANGTDATFGPLTKKPHSLWLVQYTVFTGGSDVNVSAYASQIGLEPNDSLLVDGGEETVLANLENRTVKITDVGGLLPKAGTNVTVKYYYSTPVETVRNNSASQTQFGRVFETSIYDESLTSIAAAQEYGDAVLEKYAFGRETISFQITRHGLLPGQAITVASSTMGLSADFLIQEVQFAGIAVQNDKFMVVASVQCGAFVNTLIETLQPSYSAGAGRIPARSGGKVSNIATDLGDIVAGRAIFTDGGTARFNWGTPNGATGIVIGLEDIAGNAYGAQYIYDGGTVRAKVGRLTGLPNIGSITPTGWGIYTTNGYFSGQVVASQVIGGTIVGGNFIGGTIEGVALVGQTIEGAQITGGTITSVLLDSSFITNGTISSMAGSIGGFTIDNNLLWSNGGTIATGSVVNSSNPGAYLTGSGLFGFGTTGMTFGLWTDPAKAPWFSSGTINNVVYEVYESGVLRTGPDVFGAGGVQIDNSGVFGVNPITGASSLALENGDKLLQENGRGFELYGLKFALDAVTGKLYAENAYIQGAIHANEGQFTGTVTASQIVGGTITGAAIVGQVITGNDIQGGTITGVVFTGGTVSQGTVSAALISGGTVSGAVFSGGTVSQGTISAAAITGGTISGGQISGGTINGAVFTGGTVSQGTISAAAITGGQITGGTVSGALVSGGTVSGALVSGGTFSGGTTSGGTISTSRMTSGTITGALLSGNTLQAAGGTVEIANSGLEFKTLTTAWPNPANILWSNAGTIYAHETTLKTGSLVWNIKSIGENAGNDSSQYDRQIWGAGNNATDVRQTATYWGFHHVQTAGDLEVVRMQRTETLFNCNVLSASSAANHTLGDTTHAWRYLYLYDGTDEWRIAINTSGSIVTTKV